MRRERPERRWLIGLPPDNAGEASLADGPGVPVRAGGVLRAPPPRRRPGPAAIRGGARGGGLMKVVVGLAPGDIAALVRLHGEIYWKEHRYDRRFREYVAAGLAGLVSGYDAARDSLWLVKQKGRIIGSIAIVHRPRRCAQLRWFLVAPASRGKGLGKRLMSAALRFARSAGYRSVCLWTTSELDAARHVYESAGFRRTARRTKSAWGRRAVTEEKYSLRL